MVAHCVLFGGFLTKINAKIHAMLNELELSEYIMCIFVPKCPVVICEIVIKKESNSL